MYLLCHCLIAPFFMFDHVSVIEMLWTSSNDENVTIKLYYCCQNLAEIGFDFIQGHDCVVVLIHFIELALS